MLRMSGNMILLNVKLSCSFLVNCTFSSHYPTRPCTCTCTAATDHAIYEEVEAYNKHRPVLIFGALADQVVSSLLESYPTLFYSCPTGTITWPIVWLNPYHVTMLCRICRGSRTHHRSKTEEGNTRETGHRFSSDRKWLWSDQNWGTKCTRRKGMMS